MRRGVAAALILAALAAMAAGWGRNAPPEVRVFAASSLTDVLEGLAPDYEKETGTKVVLNLASSSTLAHQVVEGAPCDLFLSADEEWADFAWHRSGGNREGVLLTNRLVVVLANPAPKFLSVSRCSVMIDLPVAIGAGNAIIEALSPGAEPRGDLIRRIAIADPEHVPAGRYARRGLESLGLWEKCRDRLVPCDSVRSALALVQRGEADAGIVYRTDALSAGLAVVLYGYRWDEDGTLDLGKDPGPSGAAEFPGIEARVVALVRDGGGGQGSRFLTWLRGPKAAAAFRAAGFGIPGEGR